MAKRFAGEIDVDQVKGRKDRGVLCGRVSDGNDGKKDMTVLENRFVFLERSAFVASVDGRQFF